MPEPDEIDVAVVRKDDFAMILGCNDQATDLLGWASDELAGRRSLDFIHPDDQGRAIEAWFNMLGSTEDGPPSQWRHLCKDGSYLWVESTNRNLLDSRGYVEARLTEIPDPGRDLPPEEPAAPRQSGATLVASVMGEQEWLLTRLAQSLPIGVALIDARGTLDFANDRIHQLMGVSTRTTTTELLLSVAPAFRSALMMELERAFAEGSDADLDIEVVNSKSQLLATCSVNVRPMSTQPGSVTKVLFCIQDVTESSMLREQLMIRATTDTLTGCWNRASTFEFLTDLLSRHQPAAVLFVDVNGLKVVNDRFGHAAGDALLADVGECLRSTARSNDVVGRIGGDEFLVVCPGISDSETAYRLSCRYAEVMSNRRSGEAMASIGVAYTASGHVLPDQIVAAADTAMYRAKGARTVTPVLATMD